MNFAKDPEAERRQIMDDFAQAATAKVYRVSQHLRTFSFLNNFAKNRDIWEIPFVFSSRCIKVLFGTMVVKIRYKLLPHEKLEN